MRNMMKKRHGRIINITSVVGVTGNPGQANYVASKAGVIGLTKSLAQELAARNVTVNAVAPGFIATPMTDVLNDKQKEMILGRVPAGKLGTPEDIAACKHSHTGRFLAPVLAGTVGPLWRAYVVTYPRAAVGLRSKHVASRSTNRRVRTLHAFLRAAGVAAEWA